MLSDKFNTTLGIPCHWPISHLAFEAHSGRFWLLINAWHLLISSVQILLLSFLGWAQKKALNVLFLNSFFVCLFSQGYPCLFPVGSRADCPQWPNVCGANFCRSWVSCPAICHFPTLPTFFNSFHGSQPSSFTIYFSSLPIPLLQVSQLENNCCKVGLFVCLFNYYYYYYYSSAWSF